MLSPWEKSPLPEAQDLHSYIRAKVRETSRLLLELRKITGKLSATL